MAKIVHERIAKTAKAMCEAWYEDAAHENLFYQLHPSMKRYVATKWRFFIGYARECLTHALQSPKLSEAEKEEIYEALVIDGTFKASPIIQPEAASLH